MMSTARLSTIHAERSCFLSVETIRRRALQRLYDRRAAVEQLILSLERYQQARQQRQAECMEFSAERRC